MPSVATPSDNGNGASDDYGADKIKVLDKDITLDEIKKIAKAGK